MAFYFKCPQCSAYFHIGTSPRAVLIGPGTRACRSCKAVFNDGSAEWADLPKKERFHLLFPILYKIFFPLLLIVPLLSLGQIMQRQFWVELRAVAVLMAAAYLPYGLMIGWAIRKSLERKPETRPA